MSLFRSFNEIVNSMRERLRLTQPNLDTKPGTVSRDLFIDIQAEQIEKLHKAAVLISEKQSPAVATGSDLDKWASNFGIARKGGSFANGKIVFTANELSSDIPIPINTIVTAKNGTTFKTIGSFTMAVSDKSRYAAIASRSRKMLNLLGITDRYAIEIPVQATSIGRTSNLAPNQIISSNLREGLRVVNLTSFNDGTNAENDAAFRARVFATFSGSNTGTAAGYRNAALSLSGVLDAIVIEPGNSLMLRDGTETIEVNDGTFRILNSGTGGKVDLYILGKQLIEASESYIYVDRSGNGDPTDERNNFIPGISFLDSTLTSEERRLLAFKEGKIPIQPVDQIVSLSGTSSGVLLEKTLDAAGNTIGNFELAKDLNVDTGGSPFGYDYIKFISGKKDVVGEVIIKQQLNGVDQLRFTDITSLDMLYQDKQILQENSVVSSVDRSLIYLNHSPIVTVSRVINRTTGEVYVIESQNIDAITGLNQLGYIKVSGKSLPTTADILSVDYTWRHIFDPYMDYNGSDIPQIFKDSSISDSINWGVSNGIKSEDSLITQSDDGFEYQLETDYNISKVLSVFSSTTTTSTVTNITNTDGDLIQGLVLGTSDSVILNIVSIKNAVGLEVWNTRNNDGSFNIKTIYLPTDSPTVIGDILTINYNKIELYNITSTDGSFSNNVITLPSEDILLGGEVFEEVEDLFLTESTVHVSYIAAIETILPSVALNVLPITGSSSSDRLSDSNLLSLTTSNQPIFFKLESDERTEITKFGPTRLACTVTGLVKAGKIKISGTTLNRFELEIDAGLALDGLTVDLEEQILEFFELKEIPITLGVARVDSVYFDDSQYDIAGYSLANNEYDLSYALIGNTLGRLQFTLPSTSNNLELAPSSTANLKISCLVYYNNDFEDLYFPADQTITSNKVFGRIDRITVSSGFRSSTGAISGTLSIKSANQPITGLSYSADYSFVAPKEGERITVRYNMNNLITETTRAIESVRPITANVLVKEAFEINVDVVGEVLINETATESSTQIVENVISAIVNLLNTGTLASMVDYSDLITAATAVTGVDSVNISIFNESGSTGKRNFIKSLDNQTIASGTVIFTPISRKNFKIT